VDNGADDPPFQEQDLLVGSEEVLHHEEKNEEEEKEDNDIEKFMCIFCVTFDLSLAPGIYVLTTVPVMHLDGTRLGSLHRCRLGYMGLLC